MAVLWPPTAIHYSKRSSPTVRAAPTGLFPFLARARSATRSRPSPARKVPAGRSHSKLPVATDRVVSRPVCAHGPRSQFAATQPSRSIAQKKSGAVFFPNQVALLARRKRPASSAPLSNRVFPARLREGNHSASTAARLCPYNSSVQSAELASVSRKYRLACDGHYPESRAGRTL